MTARVDLKIRITGGHRPPLQFDGRSYGLRKHVVDHWRWLHLCSRSAQSRFSAQLPIPVPGQNNGSPPPRKDREAEARDSARRWTRRSADNAEHRRRRPRLWSLRHWRRRRQRSCPRKFYETLMELKPTICNSQTFRLCDQRIFSLRTSNGQPYKTRIVIRKPGDNSKFNGLILAGKYPISSGNPYVPFHPVRLQTASSAWTFFPSSGCCGQCGALYPSSCT